ncbi:MAG: NYN domain-containing protein [Clostridiales bacterium]|nr:NYN domain-containing protein [Clostridiales bacterium]
MTRCLIVDGYNIINSWPELINEQKISLEGSRQKLLEFLEDYRAYKGIKVIVVFDAHMVKGSMEKHENFGKIEVVYTKENQTADSYIEKLADQVGSMFNIQVATSDWLEQQVVLGRGASRISARELRYEVMHSRKKMTEKYRLKNSDKKHTLENRLDLDVREKLDKLRRQR